jgi:hypothetical protein
MEPLDKPFELLVSPHPGWKALKSIQGLGCTDRGPVAHVLVYGMSIGPVSLSRDDLESKALYQSFGDGRTRRIEL